MTSLPDRQRRTTTWVVIGVAAAVLAIVGAVLVVSLLSNLQTGTGPRASASPEVSATSESSATPGASASAADGRLMQVMVDGLRLRATASTSADIVRSFDRGEIVSVKSGPVEADGYPWYEVVDLDGQSGWVAMGDGTEPWLEAVPPDPATSELLLRLERNCDVGIRDVGIPVVPADLTLTADGRVVLITGVVLQLSPSGLAQVQRDVLQSPFLQTSATHDLEHQPGAPEPPGHGGCLSTFTLGEGTEKVVVTAANWQGDEEEALYWVPSPERRTLDELAIHLLDVEAWLGPAAWSEPVARRYVSGSYLFWLTPEGSTPQPPEVDAPSVTGMAWPFDGPIEEFGETVGQERCGYLDLAQAFETLTLMRASDVPTYAVGEDAPPELSLDRFGAGAFATDAGWFTFWLTPRSPDNYPSCTKDS